MIRLRQPRLRTPIHFGRDIENQLDSDHRRIRMHGGRPRDRRDRRIPRHRERRSGVVSCSMGERGECHSHRLRSAQLCADPLRAFRLVHHLAVCRGEPRGVWGRVFVRSETLGDVGARHVRSATSTGCDAPTATTSRARRLGNHRGTSGRTDACRDREWARNPGTRGPSDSRDDVTRGPLQQPVSEATARHLTRAGRG